jgi:hypothetical protein
MLAWEVMMLQKRVWIKSGVIEVLDERDVRLLNLVYEKIVYYYQHLYGTRPCYQYPLSLSRLMKLSHRSGAAVRSALRYLANTIPLGSHEGTLIYYDRIQSVKNKSHRPYRIFLRHKSDPLHT